MVRLAGGLLSAAGSFASGVLAYWLCRLLGDDVATWLLGKKEFEKGEKIAARVGGWVVVLSRWLPVFPEVVAAMAGITRMPAKNFYLALACSSLPLGFTYAMIGNSANENPTLAIILSACIPPAIWWVVSRALRARLKESE